MINGRVRKGNRDLGSGFCFADRIVATAAHVVAGHDPADLTFVTSGISFAVTKMRVEKPIDTALLWVGQSLAYEAHLEHATHHAEWQVTAQPEPAAVQLTGTVSAVDHLMTNAGGHEMTVLQLKVREELKEYAGYSGSAVVVGSAVVGILVEQVKERGAPIASRRQAANVLFAVPIGKVVKRFGVGRTPRSQRAETLVHHLINTKHFDMDPLKSRIFEVISDSDDRVVAFGLADVDMKVVENLSEWLEPYIGEAVRRGQLALRPEVKSLEATVQYVTRYLAELDRRNVICPVLVDGVATDQVVQLWSRIRSAGAGRRNRLILFLVGTPAGGFPDQVDVLPSPSVQRKDIADWARLMVAQRRWPSSLAEPWTAQIVSQASVAPDEGSPLDMRLTYEALEHYIERVRLEPNALLADLEDWENRC
jgi:hypothetical protein